MISYSNHYTNIKNYNNIYIVNFNIFFCSSDKKCNSIFIYLGNSKTIDVALKIINCNYWNFSIYEISHMSMNIDNNFTYIGSRNDCLKKLSFYKSGGGFIIEPYII